MMDGIWCNGRTCRSSRNGWRPARLRCAIIIVPRVSFSMTMEMDGRVYRLTKGQGVEIAPGVPHQARNEEDAAVAILVVSAPKSHGDRVDASLAASSDAVPD